MNNCENTTEKSFEDCIYRIMRKSVVRNSDGSEVKIWLQLPASTTSIKFLDSMGHSIAYLKYKHLWSLHCEDVDVDKIRRVIVLRDNPDWYFAEYAISFENILELRKYYKEVFNYVESNIEFELTVE